MNWHWPCGSQGRWREYRPWYRMIWGVVWVGPLYLAYGLLVLVAVCAFMDFKAAIRWVGR